MRSLPPALVRRAAAAAAATGLALLPALPASGAVRAASPSPSPAASSAASAAAKAPVVTFGVQPATPQGTKGVVAPDSRPYLYYAAAPGSTITDHVAVLNYSDAPLTLKVYATDALNDDAGGFALLEASRRATDVATWTNVASARMVTVPGRTKSADGSQTLGSAIIPISIAIPKDAAPGDHVGGVIASLQSQSSNVTGPGVTLDQRVASRLFVRVAGALSPQLVVDDLVASYDGTLNPVGKGSATITFTVRNPGNVKLGARAAVDVSGLLGQHARVDLPDLPLLLPGNSVRLTATVPDVLPQVRNSATVTLTPLVLQGDAVPEMHDITASTSFWAVPWTLIGLLVALILLATWWWSRRSRTPAAPSGGGRHSRQTVNA